MEDKQNQSALMADKLTSGNNNKSYPNHYRRIDTE